MELLSSDMFFLHWGQQGTGAGGSTTSYVESNLLFIVSTPLVFDHGVNYYPH